MGFTTLQFHDFPSPLSAGEPKFYLCVWQLLISSLHFLVLVSDVETHGRFTGVIPVWGGGRVGSVDTLVGYRDSREGNGTPVDSREYTYLSLPTQPSYYESI